LADFRNLRSKPRKSNHLRPQLYHGLRLRIQASTGARSTPGIAPTVAPFQENPGTRVGSSPQTTRRNFATAGARSSPTAGEPQFSKEGRKRTRRSPHRRRHTRVQPTLPSDQVRNIPGLSQQPMGVTLQSTINEQNAIVSKKRLTHDSTFAVLAGIPSQNKRIKMEELVACRFGLETPSDHAPRRQPPSTEPNDPHFHTKGRLVQGLPRPTRRFRARSSDSRTVDPFRQSPSARRRRPYRVDRKSGQFHR
jgi:hypothetical protein